MISGVRWLRRLLAAPIGILAFGMVALGEFLWDAALVVGGPSLKSEED